MLSLAPGHVSELYKRTCNVRIDEFPNLPDLDEGCKVIRSSGWQDGRSWDLGILGSWNLVVNGSCARLRVLVTRWYGGILSQHCPDFLRREEAKLSTWILFKNAVISTLVCAGNGHIYIYVK